MRESSSTEVSITQCVLVTTELPHYRGSLLKSLSPAELGCGPGLQTEVMVVGLGCVALVALVLVISSLCCLCRNKLRLLASTCAVSARENSYKVRSERRKHEGRADILCLELLRQLCLPRENSRLPQCNRDREKSAAESDSRHIDLQVKLFFSPLIQTENEILLFLAKHQTST